MYGKNLNQFVNTYYVALQRLQKILHNSLSTYIYISISMSRNFPLIYTYAYLHIYKGRAHEIFDLPFWRSDRQTRDHYYRNIDVLN